jgi:hypothetical protein
MKDKEANPGSWSIHEGYKMNYNTSKTSYTFEVSVDPVKMSTTLDGANMINTMAQMRLEIEEYIEKRKKLLTHKKVYNKAFLKEVKLDIARQEGYIKGLQAIAYLCGYDFYFFDGAPQPDAFAEYAEDGCVNDTKVRVEVDGIV